MKWLKIIATSCTALMFAMTLSGCAPSSKHEGTGGYFDDSVITTKVKSALLGTRDIKSREISVETFKGRVQLRGFVSSYSEAQRAISVAKGVSGVTEVINDMRIK